MGVFSSSSVFHILSAFANNSPSLSSFSPSLSSSCSFPFLFFHLPSSIPHTVNDTRGRPFPGNPAEKDGHQWVRCWNESSVVVKIVDNCPAVQWKFNHAEPQMWCSADVYHIDLSYWAFEKLAHPVYG